MRPISDLVGVVSKEASGCGLKKAIGCGLKGDRHAWGASACGLKSRLASNTPSLGEYSLKTDPLSQVLLPSPNHLPGWFRLGGQEEGIGTKKD